MHITKVRFYSLDDSICVGIKFSTLVTVFVIQSYVDTSWKILFMDPKGPFKFPVMGGYPNQKKSLEKIPLSFEEALCSIPEEYRPFLEFIRQC